jgi:GDP-mannose 6-dehydrogenase
MGSKKVAMMGVSFKEGTDDLRESPLVSLAEILIGKGFDLQIFDPNVEYASLYGSNKEFIDKELPHLKRILVSAGDALDLVRIAEPSAFSGQYDGLYW